MAAGRARDAQPSMEALGMLPVVCSLPAPLLPLTQEEEDLLPPYTTEEWMHESTALNLMESFSEKNASFLSIFQVTMHL